MQRNVLLFMMGFVLGGAAGYLLTKKMLENDYAQMAQEEIDSVKEHFEKKKEVAEKVAMEDIYETTIADVAGEDTIAERNVVSGATLAGTSTNEYNKAKMNYNLIRGSVKEAPIEDEDEAEPADEDASVDATAPYIINEPSFSEDFIHHSKVSLIYYAGDDTLADEDETIFDDIDGKIGLSNLENLHISRNSVIYVRNERIGVDYEIGVDLNSYQQVILGLPPGMSPREQQEWRTAHKDADTEE